MHVVIVAGDKQLSDEEPTEQTGGEEGVAMDRSRGDECEDDEEEEDKEEGEEEKEEEEEEDADGRLAVKRRRTDGQVSGA